MEGATECGVVKKLQGPSNQRFFLVANFRHLGTEKKRADESNKENCCTPPELGRIPN
jgi:hypothetical protein